MYLIVAMACVGVLWICSEPTIRLRNFILGKHQGIFRRLLECAMCSTWWIYLIYTFICFGYLDILGASVSAVLAELIYKKLDGFL